MVRRCLSLAVIVTGLSACDNVEWGGSEVSLLPPPPVLDADGNDPRAEDGDAPLPALPEGPLLLVGNRDSTTATLAVVGEIRGDIVVPLATEEDAPGYIEYLSNELLTPGTEFMLFAAGARVGRMIALETGVDNRYCQSRPTVTGVVEMLPSALAADRFLALPISRAGARGYSPYVTYGDTYEERQASIEMASNTVDEVGARRPPALVPARADLRPIELAGVPGRSIATTFLFNDQLRIGAPSRNGWSMFILGVERDGAIRRAFSWYRSVEESGKGAPRLLDHLDWDNDGVAELLLEVFGTDTRWFATVDRSAVEVADDRERDWSISFEDACGVASSAPAEG